MALYHNPRARIRINGALSDPVTILNGTPQGCPLSPLLYVLIMEHLTTAICNDLDIQGITIKKQNIKCQYADNLLLYITNPVVTIPNLIQEFNRFGAMSNFKVNYDKSEALNITLSNKTLDLLQRNFSFKWQKVAIKYLGTHIPRDLTKLQELNCLSIIQNIIKLLHKYDRMVFSRKGRINIVKMDILPKLLYIFQTVPIFFL